VRHDLDDPPAPAQELVVLLDARHRPIGTAPKATVHTAETPLHLAFSLYLFDDIGRLLVTRRALTKLTWPGVWTNTCCGHPGPDEPMADAVARRLRAELGLQVADLREALPDFAYRATDASGIVENEFCPVFTGRVADADAVHPDPAEVVEHVWTPWTDLVAAVDAAPFAFSPWLVEQARGLRSVHA
jgi:isopentenyl-diphosphate delta-isomerase type 1